MVMIFCIIVGVIFIIMGIISLKDPVFAWKLKLICNADEPTDWDLWRIKFNGFCYILGGIIAILSSPFL